MSRVPVTSRPGRDDLLGQVGDLQHVVVGLGRQAAHEVELHLPPPGGVGRGDGADQVFLGHHLVDDLADALAAALGCERQTGTATVAGELVGQVDVERVDAGRRQRQRGLGALVAVGEALGHRRDLAVVGAGQRQQPDLFEAGRLQAALDHLADALDRALAHRPGDHAGLAEPAAARAAAEDLDRHPLVHRLGERHEGLLGIGPLVEVHHRVLADPPRHARAVGRDPLDAPVGQVVDVVEARHVDAAGLREPHQQPVAPARAALGLPRADDRGDLEHDLLAVAEHRRVDEVGDRLGVERRVAAGDDDRVARRRGRRCAAGCRRARGRAACWCSRARWRRTGPARRTRRPADGRRR